MRNIAAINGRSSFAIAALLSLFPLVSAAAQEARDGPSGVIELFTSEGCSSCPPADAIFADLARSGDVVALAYHVDYWDYLGWKDTLATAENTSRQRNYAKVLKSSVYTPQAVVNGRVHVVGSRRELLEAALSSMAGTDEGLTIPIAVTAKDTRVVIDVGAAPVAARASAEANVVLVYFAPETRVAVREGENDGKTISYVNAVTDFQTIGMWSGTAKRFELPQSAVAGSGGWAVLLQAARPHGPGPILGAAIVQ